MSFGFMPGETSPEVTDWQNGLNLLGFNIPVSGAYDEATSAATVSFKMKAGLPANDMVDGDTTNALYAQIDQLGTAVDDQKPVVGITGGAQSPLAIIGRAPSWLWWVGAGLVVIVGGYTIKRVAFGSRYS